MMTKMMFLMETKSEFRSFEREKKRKSENVKMQGSARSFCCLLILMTLMMRVFYFRKVFLCSKIFLIKTFDQSARGKTHIVEIKNTYTYFHTFERSIKEREGEGEDERSSRSDCW